MKYFQIIPDVYFWDNSWDLKLFSNKKILILKYLLLSKFWDFVNRLNWKLLIKIAQKIIVINKTKIRMDRIITDKIIESNKICEKYEIT